MKTAQQMPAHAGAASLLLPLFGQEFAITGSAAALRTVSEMIEHGDIGDMAYEADEIASLESEVSTAVGAGQRITGHYCAIEAVRMLAGSVGYARHRRAQLAYRSSRHSFCWFVNNSTATLRSSLISRPR